MEKLKHAKSIYDITKYQYGSLGSRPIIDACTFVLWHFGIYEEKAITTAIKYSPTPVEPKAKKYGVIENRNGFFEDEIFDIANAGLPAFLGLVAYLVKNLDEVYIYGVANLESCTRVYKGNDLAIKLMNIYKFYLKNYSEVISMYINTDGYYCLFTVPNIPKLILEDCDINLNSFIDNKNRNYVITPRLNLFCYVMNFNLLHTFSPTTTTVEEMINKPYSEHFRAIDEGWKQGKLIASELSKEAVIKAVKMTKKALSTTEYWVGNKDPTVNRFLKEMQEVFKESLSANEIEFLL